LASCFNVSCIFYNVFIGHDSVYDAYGYAILSTALNLAII